MNLKLDNQQPCYECVFCAQGPIYLVEIVPQQLGRFRICAECERMWKEGDPMDEGHAIDFISFMEQHHEKPIWSNLKKLSELR
jgi:hypothetical protein